MTLPIRPPFEPLELRAAETIPDGPQWQYEPKWDGFRCLAFRDRDEIYLQSKSGEPLARYFPEVVDRLRALKCAQFVVDGELVIPSGDAFSFDALLQRIHPAASRVAKLSQETPARYLIFDLLVEGRTDLTGKPLSLRREALERFAAKQFGGDDIRLSAATTDRAQVDRWFGLVGSALDGVVAKRRDLAYASGSRDGGVKIKRLRTADCVVGGYRLNKDRTGVGSLLLGLYDENGTLHHVGYTSSFRASERASMLERVRPLEKPPGFTGSAPGGPSRWRRTEEPWFPLAPKLVVEVRYDHVTGGRFRHGTTFLRWRPDKQPRLCTMEQIRSEGLP